MTNSSHRKIIHVDMDAFFASVEQRDNPELQGKPVAVGGSSLRGVVAAASYEARKYGVHSAMPSVTARRKCPDLIFVKSRFDVYKHVSEQIREIFSRYTDLVEPLSLDEAYLDVTDRLAPYDTARMLAQVIQADILGETGLTASAGISYNKFLAKTASGLRKPHGLTVIAPEVAARFIAALPIEKFHGIGPATARRMHDLGIRTGQDLRDAPLTFLEDHFGKSGLYYHTIAHGIDDRPVQPNRIRKSIGAERTFSADLQTFDEAKDVLPGLVEKVWEASLAKNLFGREVTVKIKYSDFTKITRSMTLPFPVTRKTDLEAEALRLIEGVFPAQKSIRLLGVKIAAFEPSSLPPTLAREQYDLFGEAAP